MRTGPLKKEVSLWYQALDEADDDLDMGIPKLWAKELVAKIVKRFGLILSRFYEQL